MNLIRTTYANDNDRCFLKVIYAEGGELDPCAVLKVDSWIKLRSFTRVIDNTKVILRNNIKSSIAVIANHHPLPHQIEEYVIYYLLPLILI